MKKTVFCYLLLFGLSALNPACRKNVAKAEPGLIGEWSEQESGELCRMSLTIGHDGSATLESKTQLSDCRHLRAVKGKAKIKGSVLHIGLLNSYNIVHKPATIDTLLVRTGLGEFKSAVSMQLNDMVLFKLIK